VCLSEDSQLCRVHAVLGRVAGLWTIVDDGLSRNGTFLNGRRPAHRGRLRDRDKIRVGETVLTFCAPPQTTIQQTVVGGSQPAATRLTQAQRSVLLALCRRYQDARAYASPASNQQIADELSLSLDAVGTHLRVLFHIVSSTDSGIDPKYHKPVRNTRTSRAVMPWCRSPNVRNCGRDRLEAELEQDRLGVDRLP